MKIPRLLLRGRACAFTLLCVLSTAATAAFAQGSHYTSIVVFGDSLSDTGDDATLSYEKYGVPVPGPYADYTLGRFTDGYDTRPYTLKYQGVWVEQLATMLGTPPRPTPSLGGGTDYAYGFATTEGGTSPATLGSSSTQFITVENVGQQITDYLGKHPKINDHTLFVVWAGSIDVLYATSPEAVIDAGIRQAANVQRLIRAGAKHILVPNLPPLGATPRFNLLPSEAGTATEASRVFNDTLAASLDLVQIFEFWKGAHIYRLDVFSLVMSVDAAPSKYFLSNVTGTSRDVPGVDPDTYLFWDDIHPTTHGHNILALAALKLIDPYECQIQSGPWMQPSCEAVP